MSTDKAKNHTEWRYHNMGEVVEGFVNSRYDPEEVERTEWVIVSSQKSVHVKVFLRDTEATNE